MFKVRSICSTNNDSYESGKKAAMEINNDNCKLGMIFTGSDVDNYKVLSALKDNNIQKPIIGCTTNGVITKDNILTNKDFTGVFEVSDEDLIVGVAAYELVGNPRELGKKLARAAITNAGIKKVPAFFYMISSLGNEEEYLKGIEDVIGTVPFFGNSTKGEIICNDNIIKNGCAVAVFYSRVEIKNIYTGEYDETSNAGVITKIDGNRKLLEIDKKPALEVYKSWVNSEEDDVLHPLAVKDSIGSITRVMKIVSINGNALVMSNNLALGTAVMQMSTNQDSIVKSHSNVLNRLNAKMKKPISGYFLIESYDRFNAIVNKNELFKEIKKNTNDKEFMMILSDGEAGSCDHSANTFGSNSMSFTTFSE